MNKLYRRVINKSLCIACGTCQAVCPTNAIHMVLSRQKGTYIPVIDENRCNGCNLCYTVCPGHTVDYDDLNRMYFGKIPDNFRIGNYRAGFSAFATDEKLRFDCSSGGLVTALLIYALDKKIIDGALVTRMKAGVPWEPEPFIARNGAEIIEAAGSKYCPVPLNVALKEILETDGKYAVVGLPCHIHAIRNAQNHHEELRKRITLTFGLFCASGKTFCGVQTFLQRYGLTLDDVVSLKYRGQGWPGKVRVTTKSGLTISSDYENAYSLMCFNDPYRCSLCPDKSAELADMSFGDFWLGDSRKENGTGKSVCIVRSKSAQALFRRAEQENIISAQLLEDDRLVKAVQPTNKKKNISARILLCRILGRTVPSIHIPLEKYGLKNIIQALRFYLVQLLCQSDLLKRVYIFCRPKYRRLKATIESSPGTSSRQNEKL